MKSKVCPDGLDDLRSGNTTLISHLIRFDNEFVASWIVSGRADPIADQVRSSSIADQVRSSSDSDGVIWNLGVPAVSWNIVALGGFRIMFFEQLECLDSSSCSAWKMAVCLASGIYGRLLTTM